MYKNKNVHLVVVSILCADVPILYMKWLVADKTRKEVGMSDERNNNKNANGLLWSRRKRKKKEKY